MGKETTTLPVDLAEVFWGIDKLKCLSPTPASNVRWASRPKECFDTTNPESLASWI